jgi:chemotaxis protein MotB
VPKLSLPEDVQPEARISIRPASPQRHGGAWKVAYADFVTALMALFIVLWMMNSSERVKASVRGYFRDPRGYTRTLGAGPAGSGETLRVERHNLSTLQQQLEQAIHEAPELGAIGKNVLLSITGEGLRIELLETEQGMFFVSGNDVPTAAGKQLLEMLGRELGRLPNHIVVEGHTDARPFRNAGPTAGYSNWELATDRANAARRMLNAFGVRPDQIEEVRGFADRKPLNAADPADPWNRRVSVVVKLE